MNNHTSLQNRTAKPFNVHVDGDAAFSQEKTWEAAREHERQIAP
jgi:hypothetical protein